MTALTPSQRELVRLSLLRYLDAAEGFGLGEGILLSSIRAEGFRVVDESILQKELQYLQDKGFIAVAEKTISPELRRWRITANGRDLLAQN